MMKNLLALITVTVPCRVCGTALAQNYPNKPIRIIIPAGAGDSCDILTRLIAPK
jgi:tripartite-type tricarboxylate transporter receptor subunit TctC